MTNSKPTTTDGEREAPRPQSVFFFWNGTVAVCDQNGEQMQKYQGEQAKALAAMEADGIDWREIPERYGEPDKKLPMPMDYDMEDFWA